MTDSQQNDPQQIFAISRPHSSLVIQYLLSFPLFIPILICKYYTLRYRFDNEGISMSWGLLFRREINLTYRRIQDIHLSRNLVERWLGLATLSVQTASGQSSAEMAIQGVKEFEALREFIYQKMRGRENGTTPNAQQSVDGNHSDEALELLHQIHQDLRLLRHALSPSTEQTQTLEQDESRED